MAEKFDFTAAIDKVSEKLTKFTKLRYIKVITNAFMSIAALSIAGSIYPQFPIGCMISYAPPYPNTCKPEDGWNVRTAPSARPRPAAFRPGTRINSPAWNTRRPHARPIRPETCRTNSIDYRRGQRHWAGGGLSWVHSSYLTRQMQILDTSDLTYPQLCGPGKEHE